MTTPDNERHDPATHAKARVTVDTQVADAMCDQCMDPATHRVLVDDIPLFLVCIPHVSVVLGFIEAQQARACGADCPTCNASRGRQ
jgi:hypothetical protein